VSAYELYGPDWVLLDLSMHRVNGLEALREILAAHPEARVAIVTQHDSPTLRVAAYRAGALRYFLKDDLTQLRALSPRTGFSAAQNSTRKPTS